MAKNKYTIAGDYSSPTPYDTEQYQDEENSLSAEAINYLLLVMRNIIDERIEKRIKGGQDIAQVYTAEITSKTTADTVVGNVTVGDKDYNVTTEKITAVTVRYNEDDYADISNDTVQILNPNDRWIKICTYDGVNFYVLHCM